MDIETYRELCKRTCPDLGEKLNLTHMVMGMNTEVYELKLAVDSNDLVNIEEEVADFCWYFFNYLNFRGLPTPFLDIRLGAHFIDLYGAVAEIQDVVKKYVAYNKSIEVTLEEKLISDLYEEIYTFAHAYNFSLLEALKRNIEKLQLRYPEKFDEDKAINRDLEGERKILEGGSV